MRSEEEEGEEENGRRETEEGREREKDNGGGERARKREGVRGAKQGRSTYFVSLEGCSANFECDICLDTTRQSLQKIGNCNNKNSTQNQKKRNEGR